jgi:hypothetical protein
MSLFLSLKIRDRNRQASYEAELKRGEEYVVFFLAQRFPFPVKWGYPQLKPQTETRLMQGDAKDGEIERLKINQMGEDQKQASDSG